MNMSRIIIFSNVHLQVGEAKPVVVQADVLKEEIYNCLKSEYTTESLPLTLHEVNQDIYDVAV